jgi:V/A-type H+-transporting ATPase subunit D
MIHPTRTELLQLKEKTTAVTRGVTLLEARRQALLREFLANIAPFLASRQTLSSRYRQALDELSLTRAHEGEELLVSLAAVVPREVGVHVAERNVMGVRCRDLSVDGPIRRQPTERGYDYAATTPHTEEAIAGFEVIVEEMLAVAAYENRLKRLGEEIRRVTSRTRILEQRTLPGLRERIRGIAQHLAEREREAHFRLKRFKEGQSGGGAG